MMVTIKAEWQHDGRGVQCELVLKDPQRGTVTLPATLVIDKDDVETPQMLVKGPLKITAEAPGLAGITLSSEPA
ncbi:hypothetical protein GCM10010218_12820 [Streptomyces mashuensis]|uniref:Uncharacterized protein n=1 Tax=Streptomyces mashuensis TaxID=33904 RepID=A0A919EA20_9ACTN|nr:hypothetical protein [Streptomyces mashuensis]GHF33167.1 hypothetical protein GCM10010218_12820 [Streptomyces mashuensis]